ncbi:MAG: hypothetical protein HYV02_01845 [Deltaproteobacteria bacterium]|nr:hypothetical protein [Deltaproteobacteria bacterium]
MQLALQQRRGGKRFPKKELNDWLRDRRGWNHDEWLSLLHNLELQGFQEWVTTQEARDEIGLYLEAHRSIH